MLVSGWMTQPAHTMKPRDNAYHARQLREEHRINRLPVVAGDKLAGVLCRSDILKAFVVLAARNSDG